MNSSYNTIKQLFVDHDKKSFKPQYDHHADSLWIDIHLKGKKAGYVLVQNIDVPEIDVRIYSSSWYFSLGSNVNLENKMIKIYLDVIKILSADTKTNLVRFYLTKKERTLVEIPEDVEILKGKNIYL